MSIVIAGASLAGLSAAESLRNGGYCGEIVVAEAASCLPADRPPLSKQVLAGEWSPAQAAQRNASKLDEWSLDLRLGVRAEALVVDPLEIHLSDGTTLRPEGVVIATGSRPRVLPGGHPSGVHVLRDLDHAMALRADLQASDGRVVIIGAGFIGAEVAATCRGLGHEVTMIEAAATPLVRVLPPEIGGFVTELHRSHGVDVRLRSGVEQLEVDGSGAVAAVKLHDGTFVEASIVVVGIGVVPNVEWLEGSGLRLDNGVHCDETCLAAPRIVAAGDAAKWLNPRYGTRMRVEQWDHAIQQGEYAGTRLLFELSSGADPNARSEPADAASEGILEPFDEVPWFWSDQYDKKIQMAGYPDATDEIVIVEGSPQDGRFAALFRRGDICSAVLGVNRPRHVMQARMRMEDSLDWHGVISLFG